MNATAGTTSTPLRLPANGGHLLDVDVALSLDHAHASDADLGDDDEHDGVEDTGEDVGGHVDVGNVLPVLVVVVAVVSPVLLILEATAGSIGELAVPSLAARDEIGSLPLDLVDGALGGKDDGRYRVGLDGRNDGVVNVGGIGRGGDGNDEDAGGAKVAGAAVCLLRILGILLGGFGGALDFAKKFAQSYRNDGAGLAPPGGRRRGGSHGGRVPDHRLGRFHAVHVVMNAMGRAVLVLRAGQGAGRR
mmetsp:Transcript_12761/g.27019  ORF Transcript_12761/g.27019 Transcript_12761/m.27019 type:complete len:247 (+) Transcript_12761:163-903(+)